MSNNILEIQLSFDEFAFLQARLIIPPLLGMGNMIFPPGTTEEVGMARLQAGSASLLARGYIEQQGDNLQVDSAIFGMMSVFAMAKMAAMVYTTASIQDEATLHTYYFSPKLAVEHHYNGKTAVHAFAVTHRPNQITDLMMERMDLHDTAAAPCNAHDMPGAAFKAVSDSARSQDAQATAAAFVQGNIPQNEAEALTDIMINGGPHNTVVLMQSANPNDKRPGLDTGGTFVLYQNHDHSFRVTPDEQRARIDPIANRDIFTSLLERITPILAKANV